MLPNLEHQCQPCRRAMSSQGVPDATPWFPPAAACATHGPMPRAVDHRYLDPLAQVWLGTAARLGLTVRRAPDAYASTDGRGELIIGDDASLDADDSLAQMIFHEICHWLVQGEDAYHQADWGLDNVGDGDF